MLKKTKVIRTAKQHYTKTKRQKHSNTKKLTLLGFTYTLPRAQHKKLRSSESYQQNPKNAAPANLVRCNFMIIIL